MQDQSLAARFLTLLSASEIPLRLIANTLSCLGYASASSYAFGHAKDKTVRRHRPLAWIAGAVFLVKAIASAFSAMQSMRHGERWVSSLVYIVAALVFLAFIPVLAATNDDVRNTLREAPEVEPDKAARHARRNALQMQEDAHHLSVTTREESERLVELQREGLNRHGS